VSLLIFLSGWLCTMYRQLMIVVFNQWYIFVGVFWRLSSSIRRSLSPSVGTNLAELIEVS
jgi:hypothetical protein